MIVRALHAAMALLFGLCVAVQYNDPDPLPWMGMYGAALVLCVLGALARPPRDAAIIVGVLALVWAGTQSSSFLTCITTKDACFSSWDMHNDLVAEEAREVGGLFIVAAWSLVVFSDANRRRKRSDAS